MYKKKEAIWGFCFIYRHKMSEIISIYPGYAAGYSANTSGVNGLFRRLDVAGKWYCVLRTLVNHGQLRLKWQEATATLRRIVSTAP